MNKKEEKEFEVDVEKLMAGLENSRNVRNIKKPFKFKIKYIFILVVIFAVVGFTNSINNKQDELRKEPWAKECNDISDFEYTIENKYIRIDEYIGKDKKVKLCKNYVIDDKEYELSMLGEEVFQSKNVFSVLFPNSVDSLPPKIFYKSKVKYIYIPKSLSSCNEEYQFTHYLSDVEKIYFEGSKSEWEYLIDFDKDVDENVEEVILDTKYSDLDKNE